MKSISLEEIKRRLSISSIVFDRYSPLNGDAFEQIARAGIRVIELQENPYQYDMADINSMRYIFDLCKDADLSIYAYHSRLTLPSGVEPGDDLVALTDTCKKQIETMQEAGGYIWSSHAMQTDYSAYKLYEELLKFVEGTEVKLAIENFNNLQPIFSDYSVRKLHERLLPATDEVMVKEAVDHFRQQWQYREVEDRIKFLNNELDHPQMGMLLDVGHARDGEGNNPMTIAGEASEIVRLCGDKLFNLHLHGFKNGVDHYPPLCEGDEIKWKEIFKALKEIDYQGYFNFESLGLPLHKDTITKVAAMPEAIFEMMLE